jgi:hypothetical protein
MVWTGEGIRAVIAASVTAAMLALPGVASAQDMTMCESRSAPPGISVEARYSFQITGLGAPCQHP